MNTLTPAPVYELYQLLGEADFRHSVLSEELQALEQTIITLRKEISEQLNKEENDKSNDLHDSGRSDEDTGRE